MEMKQYLGLEGIRKLRGEKRMEWSFKDRGNFVELEWIGLAPYKVHNPFSKTGGTKTPES